MAKLISKTYGDALFELALEENAVDSLAEEVQMVLNVLEENEELMKLLRHPKIVKEEKIKIIQDIFKGRVSDNLTGFLEIIVDKDRYNEIPSIFRFFLDLVNGDFRTNINLFELGDALSNVIVKPNKITPKVGYARNKNLNIALKTTKNIDLKKVLFFYFNTTMSVKASLDELFRLLNMYHDVQPGELIRELKSFPIWVKATGIEQGKSNNITTENYLKIEPQIEVGNVILMSIVDYDYVLKEFVAKPYTGSIF